MSIFVMRDIVETQDIEGAIIIANRILRLTHLILIQKHLNPS